jgi:hypothetical protein
MAGYVVVQQETGRFWPADCGSGWCAQCGVKRVARRARQVTVRQAEVGRSRLITLTRAPADWQSRRTQVRDLARRLRAAGYQCEWIWTTEAGSRSGMIHVHAVQFGDYVKQTVLQEMWGGRIVDIRAAHQRHGAYISKAGAAVANYISKAGAAHLDEALSLNGGRLHHWSRGFWGGPIRSWEQDHRAGEGMTYVLRFDPSAARQAGSSVPDVMVPVTPQTYAGLPKE